MPAPRPARLLTVLEECAIRQLGSTRAEPGGGWILAATNEDLLGAARAWRFREDLDTAWRC